MKKNLLLGAILLGSFASAWAQSTCATAVTVTAGSTTTVTAVDGTYGPSCFGGTTNQQDPSAPLESVWYKYTATANGLLTVSSVLPANPSGSTGTDTRLSIFSGACDALVCYGFNDDVPSDTGEDLRSEAVVPVATGTTYYIAWDNNWSAAGFDFSVAFTASDCLSPNFFGNFTNITIDSASFSWDAAIGNPSSYDVEVGVIGYTPGTGTITNTLTTSVNLTDIETTNNLGVDVYVRGNCGTSQGIWIGPFRLLLVAELNYSNNFDDATNRADGFIGTEGWVLSTNEQVNANVAHTPSGFVFSNVLTTGAADQWLFTRAINVDADEEVTINFFSLLAGAAGTSGQFDVTVGNAPTAAAQTTVIDTVTFSAPTTSYTESTFTWTAPAAGTYFISFHNNSPMETVTGSLVVDSIKLTGSFTSTDEHLASVFSVYPNPADSVLNISNAENILVNNVSIVDINGRTVKTQKLENVSEAQINVSDLATGLYIMNITSDKGVISKKIIKK